MKNDSECESCGKLIGTEGGVNLKVDDSYRALCLSCYNATISKMSGFEFEQLDFDPVVMTDAHGIEREFHFGTRLIGVYAILEAWEVRDGERTFLEFSVAGDPEEDMMELFVKLFEKIRRAMSRKHIAVDDDGLYQIAQGDTVRAIIESDDKFFDYPQEPLLIIDGKEISWRQLGNMLSSYEGYQLKLEIFERTDER